MKMGQAALPLLIPVGIVLEVVARTAGSIVGATRGIVGQVSARFDC